MANGVPIDNSPSSLPLLLTASQKILSNDFTAPYQGSVVVTVTCSPSVALQVVRNGKSPNTWNAGNNLTANSEYNFSSTVVEGETINWSFVSGTTLITWEAFYVQSM